MTVNVGGVESTPNEVLGPVKIETFPAASEIAPAATLISTVPLPEHPDNVTLRVDAVGDVINFVLQKAVPPTTIEDDVKLMGESELPPLSAKVSV